jgi:alpha-beta hydrolase superfamily lysophospholipase
MGILYVLDQVANAVVRPVPREPDRTASELGVPYEDLVITCADHLLNGWLLHPEVDEGKPLVLLAHGWGANYGLLLHLAEPLLVNGNPVLLFDIRGHGTNEEVPYVTVRHFRDDVMAVSCYAAERFPDRPRVLVGHSLGGAAAVLSTEMGAPVDGLAVIASPASVLEVTADYLREKGFPGRFMVVALRPFWWRRVGGTFRDLIPEQKIGAIHQPVLVLHPELDRRVAVGQAERLARAAGAKPTVIQGAGHTDVLEHPETHRVLMDFVDAIAQGSADPRGEAVATRR